VSIESASRESSESASLRSPDGGVGLLWTSRPVSLSTATCRPDDLSTSPVNLWPGNPP